MHEPTTPCCDTFQYNGAGTFKTVHTCARGEVTLKSAQDAYFILPLSCMRAVAVVRKKPSCVRQRASTLRRTPLFCSSSSSCSSQLPSEPGWPRGRQAGSGAAANRRRSVPLGGTMAAGRCGAPCGPRSEAQWGPEGRRAQAPRAQGASGGRCRRCQDDELLVRAAGARSDEHRVPRDRLLE